ncbi:hypothetical protein H8I91_09330 [Serratia fonticola]|uniref:hypothetical protein n=1 Tax=Serratia fonticola TaxID=47917 RepID=UPI00164860E6|nr:hypothetical protein [Serratia fonticola]MBC3250463.1 hypothetical protein [Serratia fonticola]
MMEWIDIEEREPPKFKMVIFDTDKGVAVGQYDGGGKVSNVLFGFVGVNYTNFKVKRWMPMPEV